MPRHMFGKKIDEAKWSQAKAQAEKEGKGGNYAYITSIYKSMAHSEKSIEIQSATVLLKAVGDERPLLVILSKSKDLGSCAEAR